MQDSDTTEAEVREALLQFDDLWDELFPVEQSRIIQLVVERVNIGTDGLDIQLRVTGLSGLVAELRGAGNAPLRPVEAV